MGQFNSEDSRPKSWLLYTGNLGYADELKKVYQYNDFVPNHLQIFEGDLALLRDKDELLGVARIERIEAIKGKKKVHRCPVCLTTKFSNRKNKQPKFRCRPDGHEFDEPAQEDIACKLFAAYFGDSFVSAQGAIDIDVLREACPKYNRQLAMQRIDFRLIKAALVARVPAIRQLVVVNSNPDDSRQAVMRQILVRRGQQAFRQTLRTRYGDQCMITGCQLLDIIEAAHIQPYRGEADNHPENGLLLRADLHTLFDLDFLGIHPESLQVQFHPAARAAGYNEWEGKILLCSNPRPSQIALKSRWQLFQMRLHNEI